jgi:hypothetical protein
VFLVGILLIVAGAGGLLKFGVFGLFSGVGALAGLLAPDRIPAERRAANLAFLKSMGVKVVTAAAALGIGVLLINVADKTATPLETAQDAADAAAAHADDDAHAIPALANTCANYLGGASLKQPIVKTVGEDFATVIFVQEAQGGRDAALLRAATISLCAMRAGKHHNLDSVGVIQVGAGGQATLATQLTREQLEAIDGWKKPTEKVALAAVAALKVAEPPPAAAKRVAPPPGAEAEPPQQNVAKAPTAPAPAPRPQRRK